MNKDFVKNIMVIIPVHEYNDKVSDMLYEAIKSIPSDISVLISASEDAYKSIVDSPIEKRVTVAKGEKDKSSFSELVNNGVKNLPQEVKYFSILEFDDQYNANWFMNIEKYSEFNPEVSVFMPIEEIFNFNDKKFVGYGNEAPWASSFSEEIGFIDNASLQDYADYYLTGSVFNKEDWNLLGGLKESIKLSFWYEFLLRCMHNKKKVMVIPKTGYKHYINREKSLYNIYSETMSQDESLWWFKLAKTECKYKEDRKKVYKKPEN